LLSLSSGLASPLLKPYFFPGETDAPKGADGSIWGEDEETKEMEREIASWY
jgi:hypothetical protein